MDILSLNNTSPIVGVSSLIKILANVDLPQPLSPTMARLSPFCRMKFISSKALNHGHFLDSF